jgi:hypothetical protein
MGGYHKEITIEDGPKAVVKAMMKNRKAKKLKRAALSDMSTVVKVRDMKVGVTAAYPGLREARSEGHLERTVSRLAEEIAGRSLQRSRGTLGWPNSGRALSRRGRLRSLRRRSGSPARSTVALIGQRSLAQRRPWIGGSGDNLPRWVRRRVVSTLVRRFGPSAVGSTRRSRCGWSRRGRSCSMCAGGRIVRGRSKGRCGSRRTRSRAASASSGVTLRSSLPAPDCVRRRASVWRTG